MSHYPTNYKNELFDSFSLSLRENGIVLDNSVSELEIQKFEVKNKINFPDDLKYFLVSSNGFADDEMYAMSRFWRLDEYVSVSSYFNKDVIKNILTQDDLLPYKRLVDVDGTWLLPNADSFYLFGDYNVNGSYWAIELTQRKHMEACIICISDFSNVYREVTNSFTHFVDTFINKAPEELL